MVSFIPSSINYKLEISNFDDFGMKMMLNGTPMARHGLILSWHGATHPDAFEKACDPMTLRPGLILAQALVPLTYTQFRAQTTSPHELWAHL